MLSSSFLAPYRAKGDPFPNLLARSTYKGKYQRPEDASWTDTIARVVLGNVALDPNVTEDEAHFLFDTFWHGKALPPGRGLWTGGVKGIPVDARYNCHYGTLRSAEDWGWVANMLMCGGGVGVGLHSIDELPVVAKSDARLFILCSHAHPNRGEVMPEEYVTDRSAPQLLVEDSRQGWVDALITVLKCAFAGKAIAVNLSAIRKRGAIIKTFGGTACGPGPLATLLREVYAIVRRAQGRRLSSVECLDITNHIGVCIKSGNVRRSALIVLGKAHDQAFRDAKKDWQAVQAFRHSSNNSICWETEEELDTFNWRSLVDDQSEYGEPGGLNLWLIRQLDPGVEGVNPCGEIPLHDREACCLSEVYPALFTSTDNATRIFSAVARYTLRQRLEGMSDPRAEAVRASNMRIGVGLGGICDFDWTERELRDFRHTVQFAARCYAINLGVSCPIANTTVKPSGTISLLNGSSPGVHASWADYFLKRARIGVDEPIAAALIEAGVPYEPCVYDASGRTLAFAFPVAARKKGLNVQTQTVREQIDRQVAVQRSWADNAVSSTVSFAEDEKDELAALLKQHVKFDIKSVSCLPKKHGYAQAPYEAISEEIYAELVSKINHEHPLTVGGDLDTMECEGDVCPIK